MVASASPRINIPERVWLGHVNHVRFGGHQLYLWNGWSSVVLFNLGGRLVC